MIKFSAIKTYLKPLRLKLMQVWPRAYIVLSQVVSRFLYPDTTRVLHGKRTSKLDRKTIIYFSYYRCGTRFVHQCLSDLSRSEGRPIVDFEAYFASAATNKLSLLDEPDFYRKFYHARGYYCGPHYRYRPVADLERFRILLMLRDPRDVLVSRYFSEVFSHTVMNDSFAKHREKVSKMTVDEFVRYFSPELQEAYQTYLTTLTPLPNVLTVSYESMVADFPAWLQRTLQHLEMQPSNEALQKLLAQDHFSVSKEDVYSHKRSVHPGNYLRKLQPDTIEYLNEKFADILRTMDYPVSSVSH